MNLTLIGMPGSGKSYLGRKLAEKLSYELVELDLITEQAYGLSLPKVLEKLGAAEFIKKQGEEAIFHTQGKDRIVVSPGGSIVYCESAMQHLKGISKIIYLDTSFETIMERVALVPRGIVGLEEKTLEELHTERSALYKNWADVIVDSGRDPETVLNDISTALHLY